jgi:putative membrane protein
MNTLRIAEILTALVAIEHIYILWMEMFAWETVGKKTFRSLPKDLFKPTKGLAANQGLYNGFLAAGLIWTFFIGEANWAANIRLFFLGCVIVAGIFGALTAAKKIFVVQAVPAIIALIFVILA